MGTPLTDQAIWGLGSPLTLQVRMPVSFGARIRFLGALIQNGAAGGEGGGGGVRVRERERERDRPIEYPF